jgi:hypothetical protein
MPEDPRIGKKDEGALPTTPGSTPVDRDDRYHSRPHVRGRLW